MAALHRLINIGTRGFPWSSFAGSPSTVIEKVRAHARQHTFAGLPYGIGQVSRILATIAWPLVVFSRITFKSRELKIDNLSLAARLKLGRHAMLQSADPEQIHKSRIRYGVEAERHSLYDADLRGLYHWLNRGTPAAWISDKSLFHDYCRSHGIPTPENLDLSDVDELIRVASSSGLVLKPKMGARSRDVIVYRRWKSSPNAGGDYSNFARIEQKGYRPVAELSQDIRQQVEQLRDEDSIAQPFFTARPDAFWAIADLGLPTWPLYLRLVTGRHADGSIEVMVAAYCINFSRSVLNTAGLHGTVDLKSGLLSIPVESTCSVDINRFPTIPLSGFSAAMEQAVCAHKDAGDVVFLAWDLLFDGKGYVFLETNTGFSMFYCQSMLNKPIGETVFAKVFAGYV